MSRRLLSLLIAVYMLVTIWVVPVYAKECSFSLADADVQKGRLFDISFSVSGEDIASFIAEYTFDSKYLKFSSCKSVDKNAVVEVNQNDEGQIKVVYLCDEGTDSSVLTLTFKGLQESSTEVACKVSQVINTDYEDISVISCKSAKINILSQNKGNTEHKTTVASTENITRDYSESGVTVINGDSSKSEIVFFSALTVLCLMSIVGFVAYKAGKRGNRKKDKNEK